MSTPDRATPLEAYSLLSHFVVTYGRDALLLACHVSVLERMRADLVALIRANFLEGPAQANAALDAHVLFGPLTQELGGGFFRIDQEIRRQGLRLLDSVSHLRGESTPRSQRVAQLVIRYVEDQRGTVDMRHDGVFQQYLNENSWMAHALLDPERAIAALFLHMNRVNASYASGAIERSEVRFGGLAAMLDVPLPAFVTALDRARAMDAISDRDYDTAARLLADLDRTPFSAAGVDLLPMEPMMARLESLLAGTDAAASVPSDDPQAQAPAGGQSVADMESTPVSAAPRVDTALHVAAIAGDRTALASLLDLGEVAVDAAGKQGKTALHLVAERDHLDLVTFLIDRGAALDAVDDAGRTALFVAAMNGRAAVVEHLLARGAAVDDANTAGATPLMAAASNGHDAVLDVLLAHGANINAVDGLGASALGYAAYGQRRRPAWRLLADPGIDVLVRTASGSGMTHLAALGRLADVTMEVAARGAVVDEPRADGWTPLLMACWFGDVATAEVLLELGAEPNRPFQNRRTSVHIAAQQGGGALIRLLRRFGGDLRAPLSGGGYLPIHLAAGWGSVDALDALALAAPQTLAHLADDHRTPLHVACAQGRPDAVTALLAYPQTNPRQVVKDGMSPLSLAVNAKSRETVLRLLAHPDIEVNGEQEQAAQAPLQRAVALGDAEIVRVIGADRRAKLGITATNGEGLLHLAIQAGHIAVVDTLLELGTDLEAVTNFRDTPLSIALSNNRTEIVERLLRAGADPNRAAGPLRRAPLAIAVAHTFEDGVRLLLSTGVDVHPPLIGDDSLLHVAARGNADGCLNLLIARGLAVDSRNALGETPLHAAAAVGALDAIATLIAHGADIHARDSDGQTPIYPALVHDRVAAIEALFAAGAGAVVVTDRYGWTPLHVAVQRGSAAGVRQAMATPGADVHAVASEPAMTPLQAAVEVGAAEAVDALLAVGTDVMLGTHDRPSPYVMALNRFDWEMLKRLSGGGDRILAPPIELPFQPPPPPTGVEVRSTATGLFPLVMGTTIARTPSARPWRPFGKTPTSLLHWITQRDQVTCGFCGLVSQKYNEVMIQTTRPRDLSVAALACIMCQATLFLDFAPVMKNGVMIWLPGVRQEALNALMRAIYVARISQGPRAEDARTMVDLLMSRREIVRERFGSDNPLEFARQLSAAADERELARLRASFAGVLVLPLDRRIVKEGDLEFNQFPQILAYWRSKDGPFGDRTPPQWSPRTFEYMLSSRLDPASLDLPPNWRPLRSSDDVP